MGFQIPCAKSEQAFEKYLRTALGDEAGALQILRRGSLDDIATPCLTICGVRAVPYPVPAEIISGDWMVDIALTVKSPYRMTGPDEHDRFAGLVADMIIVDGLADLLNEAMSDEQFTAMEWTPSDIENRVEGKQFVTAIKGSLLMMPSKPAA